MAKTLRPPHLAGLRDYDILERIAEDEAIDAVEADYEDEIRLIARQSRESVRRVRAQLEKNDLMRETLGEHIFGHFVAAKRAEWDSYIRHVSPWEIERYLNTY